MDLFLDKVYDGFKLYNLLLKVIYNLLPINNTH
jgi:hypothetical protein